MSGAATPRGSHLGDIGALHAEQSVEGQLTFPQGLALSHGEVFITDCEDHRVAVYDALTLTYQRGFGHYGEEEGELSFPYNCAVVGDEVIVCDVANSRLSLFHRTNGQFLRCIGGDGELLSNPRDVAVMPLQRAGPPTRGATAVPSWSGSDSTTALVVVEQKRVVVLSLAGSVLQAIEVDGSVDMWSVCVVDTTVYVTDKGASLVHVLVPPVSSASLMWLTRAETGITPSNASSRTNSRGSSRLASPFTSPRPRNSPGNSPWGTPRSGTTTPAKASPGNSPYGTPRDVRKSPGNSPYGTPRNSNPDRSGQSGPPTGPPTPNRSRHPSFNNLSSLNADGPAAAAFLTTAAGAPASINGVGASPQLPKQTSPRLERVASDSLGELSVDSYAPNIGVSIAPKSPPPVSIDLTKALAAESNPSTSGAGPSSQSGARKSLTSGLFRRVGLGGKKASTVTSPANDFAASAVSASAEEGGALASLSPDSKSHKREEPPARI